MIVTLCQLRQLWYLYSEKEAKGELVISDLRPGFIFHSFYIYIEEGNAQGCILYTKESRHTA